MHAWFIFLKFMIVNIQNENENENCGMWNALVKNCSGNYHHLKVAVLVKVIWWLAPPMIFTVYIFSRRP